MPAQRGLWDLATIDDRGEHLAGERFDLVARGDDAAEELRLLVFLGVVEMRDQLELVDLGVGVVERLSELSQSSLRVTT